MKHIRLYEDFGGANPQGMPDFSKILKELENIKPEQKEMIDSFAKLFFGKDFSMTNIESSIETLAKTFDKVAKDKNVSEGVIILSV